MNMRAAWGGGVSENICIAIIALWDTGKFSTFEIASFLDVGEAEVSRIIHIRREAARGVEVA